MNSSISKDTLTYAVSRVSFEVNRSLSESTDERNEQLLWKELLCCILSSQVHYQLARSAADAIEDAGTLRSPSDCWQGIANDLRDVLSRRFHFDGRAQRYRFPATKSCQIAKTCVAIRSQSGSLTKLLSEYNDVRILREWLVHHAPGLGPKQTSMFLRNVGVTLDFAVLDRHVLNYMAFLGLLENDWGFPASLARYELIETRLRCHADTLGYRVGVLDWAIWIVMRVARSRHLMKGKAA